MSKRRACFGSETQRLCRFQRETRQLCEDDPGRRERSNGIALKTWSLSDAAGALYCLSVADSLMLVSAMGLIKPLGPLYLIDRIEC